MHTVLQPADFAVIYSLVLIAVVVLAAMLGVTARGSRVNLKSRELERLARLEAKVDLLLQHAGLTYGHDGEDDA
jgi:uncharacterized membrane protein